MIVRGGVSRRRARDISALTVDMHILLMSSLRRQSVSNMDRSGECLCSG